MRRRKDVSNRSVSFTYLLRRRNDVSAWSATPRRIWDLTEASLRRRMPGGVPPSNLWLSLMKHPLIFRTYSKFDIILCATTLKFVWNKYENKVIRKLTSSSGIYKAIYHYVSYILLFGKTKWQNFELLYSLFLLFWNKHHPPISAAP